MNPDASTGGGERASGWVVRFASLIPVDGTVLDVACGSGRHTRHFRHRGNRVVAIDRDLRDVADLVLDPGVELIEADLEMSEVLPLGGRRFDGVVVTNYLHRPLFPALIAAIAPGGTLIYETFSVGNEAFGRPRNPAHLLEAGELRTVVGAELHVVAFEEVVVSSPRPAAIQRIAAQRPVEAVPR